MKKFKKVLAVTMVMAMLVASSITSLAAGNNEDAEAEAQEVLSQAEIDELNAEMDAMMATDPELGTYLSEYQILEKVGTAAAGTTSIPFTCDRTCINNVRIILYGKYQNGSTGTITIKVAGHTYSAKVDGVSRMITSTMTIPAGNYTFKLTGVASSMTYVVRMYALA